MRWPVFAVAAFLLVICDVSLANILVIRSLGGIAPSFVAVLVVFVSLFAPRTTALWASWTLGLLMDLWTPLIAGRENVVTLLGPHALGFTFACFLLLQVRSMLFRRRVLTMAVMTVVCVIASSIVVVFAYTIHGWYPGERLFWSDMRPGAELLRRVGIACYSGVLALPVGRVLVWTFPAWAFRGGRD